MAFEMTIKTAEKTVHVKNGLDMDFEQICALIRFISEGSRDVPTTSKPPVAEQASEALQKPEVAKPAKVTPLIGAKATGFTVADRLDKKPVKGEYVQVYVRCRECTYEGAHDTVFGNQFTKCRGCGEKLHLRHATPESGVANADGDIYVAEERYLTRRERWEREQAEIAELESREPVCAT